MGTAAWRKMSSAIAALDHAISRPIQQLQLGQALEQVIQIPGCRLFGGSGLWTITVPTIIALHFLWQPVMPSLLHSLLWVWVIILPLKKLALRRRPSPKIGPPRVLQHIRDKVDHEMMSFPSGDSTQAAVIVGSMYMWAARGNAYSILLLSLVPLCMFGRVYFLCHWVLDTVAGTALGAAAVLYTYSNHDFFGMTWNKLAPVVLVLMTEFALLSLLKRLGFKIISSDHELH